MLPIVTEDEIVGSEQLSEGSGAHAVHGSWLQVHQHSPGDVFVCCTSKQEGVTAAAPASGVRAAQVRAAADLQDAWL